MTTYRCLRCMEQVTSLPDGSLCPTCMARDAIRRVLGERTREFALSCLISFIIGSVLMALIWHLSGCTYDDTIYLGRDYDPCGPERPCEISDAAVTACCPTECCQGTYACDFDGGCAEE